ncbi:6-phosphogluconolactonase-like [Choloepus didactylus]|uniref:6-phosphogluconolactonase-like n=1 Tax=Choloepus didactylus TaxID=27675 RepID=UPI00189E6601|nr:6-phosphogluconolactonase-like [Choloepus didactylus]
MTYPIIKTCGHRGRGRTSPGPHLRLLEPAGAGRVAGTIGGAAGDVLPGGGPVSLLAGKLPGPDNQVTATHPTRTPPGSREREKIVAPVGVSPEPPPRRVTFTLPGLNAARSVIVETGKGKAPAPKRISGDEEENPLPAAPRVPSAGGCTGSWTSGRAAPHHTPREGFRLAGAAGTLR